jgi:hypothetical protein
MTAYETVVDKLGGFRNGMARCPAHEDSSPSLSVTEGKDGDRAVLHCHAGCTIEQIVAALGLTVNDLFDKPSTNGNGNGDRHIVATYPYTDEQGVTLFEVVRYHPKDFGNADPTAWRLDLEPQGHPPCAVPAASGAPSRRRR